MAIDILQARQSVESLTQGLSIGTGVSFGDKSIIVYVTDYTKEAEIRNLIGSMYEGFTIKYVISGNIKPLSFQ